MLVSTAPSIVLQVYGIRHYIENFVERRWTVADVDAAELFYRHAPCDHALSLSKVGEKNF